MFLLTSSFVKIAITNLQFEELRFKNFRSNIKSINPKYINNKVRNYILHQFKKKCKHKLHNILTDYNCHHYYYNNKDTLKIVSVIFQLKKNPEHIKACVLYFLSNLYFFTKWQPFKNCEKCFLFDLFNLKSFFSSRDIQIFIIFPLPFHTFQIQKNKWKWNNLWCYELACINLQV